LNHRRKPRTAFGRALIKTELIAGTPHIRRIPFWSRERIDRLVERRLHDTVQTACEHVPCYRDRVREGSISAESIQSIADLENWPLIGLHQLHHEPLVMLSDQWKPDECIEILSSGSSGHRKRIYLEPNAFLANALGQARHTQVARTIVGPAPLGRKITMAPLASNQQKLRMMYADWLAVQPSRHADETTQVNVFAPFEEKLAQMNGVKPDVVGGVTGVVSNFFMEVLDRGVECHRPRLLSISVEGFARGHRERIKEELGIPARVSYGSVESPKLGFECEEINGYHIHEDFVVVRIVDDENRDLPEGEVGRVVITNLINRATMLINYDQGDKGYITREPCPCGRTFPRIFLTSSKETPLLKAANGRVVHHADLLRPIVAQSDFVRLQVVVESPDHWRLLVESEDLEVAKTWIDTVTGPVKEWTEGSVRLDVEFTRDFEMSPISGKQSPVIIREKHPS